ncbi:hypothetical protein L1049_002217 [Liquidambar formosana]|uniref:Uncharacterized protein n=1 Tax=Liquidambar formosana TaxID=63359 RepID=A0AAP0NGW8_LIQFO
MGGGFCADEDETDKDPDDCAYNPASTALCENADPSHCSGSIDETEHDIHPVQSIYSPKRASDGLPDGGRIDDSVTGQILHCINATSNDVSKVVAPMQENTKDDSGPTSVKVLSAMPFLRRKRRKS